MPKAKKKPTKPRVRTCLNVEVSPRHLEILEARAATVTARAGRSVTKSDLVRDWIWSLQENPDLGVDNANTTV